MATQRTHREFAPRYAVGKVPVPWSRECHWETRRSWLWKRQRSTCWVVVLGLWSFAAAKSCRERSPERQLNGAHSLHALHLQLVWRCGRFGQCNIDETDCLGVLLCNRLNDFKLAWNGMDMNALPFEFKTLRSSQAIESHRKCQYFVREDLSSCSLTVWRAGEAWPRSGHTGSSLPDMLWGKSPCLGAESATGRPEDLGSGSDSEAHAELWFLGFGPLQQQSHAVSVRQNANWTGLTLSMPSLDNKLALLSVKGKVTIE